jgi:hypothetical protein
MPELTTRVEIADLIEHALSGPTRRRDDLVAAARDAGAREGVIDTLSSLPDRDYVGLRELWPFLPQVQIGP